MNSVQIARFWVYPFLAVILNYLARRPQLQFKGCFACEPRWTCSGSSRPFPCQVLWVDGVKPGSYFSPHPPALFEIGIWFDCQVYIECIKEDWWHTVVNSMTEQSCHSDHPFFQPTFITCVYSLACSMWETRFDFVDLAILLFRLWLHSCLEPM